MAKSWRMVNRLDTMLYRPRASDSTGIWLSGATTSFMIICPPVIAGEGAGRSAAE